MSFTGHLHTTARRRVETAGDAVVYIHVCACGAEKRDTVRGGGEETTGWIETMDVQPLIGELPEDGR